MNRETVQNGLPILLIGFSHSYLNSSSTDQRTQGLYICRRHTLQSADFRPSGKTLPYKQKNSSLNKP